MNAFLTGSRVYGTPRPDSDWDLCILPDQRTADMLEMLRDEETGIIRFGVMNLIVLRDRETFDLWRQGTDELFAMRPVTRDFAIKHLQKFRLTGQSCP